ncbi:MAG: CHAD domain-containing protein, partial [Planctomycetota bacterium]|nr:CHAD domain-containing protein [Planctomycetota bacterium]
SRADELHALRIEMKKTRYAAEFFAAAFTPAAEPTASAGHRGPEPADPLAVSLNTIVKVAKSYQESLGELHDAVVAQAVLAGWLSAGVPSLAPEERNDAALRAALSDLVAAARADEATLRAAFARRWGPRDRMRLVL